MSWFDSKKLQTYAKSTLLQAQKQIDKVLDIKEEEIAAQSTTTPVLSSSSAIPAQKPTKSYQEPTSSSTLNEQESDFFSKFFTSPTQASSQLKSSSLTNFENVPADVNFEEFLNKDVKRHSPATSLAGDSVSVTENTLDTAKQTKVAELKKGQKKQKSKQAAQACSSGSNRPITPNSKSKQHSIELEKIEKQNRVKSYVDTDGGNSLPEESLTTCDLKEEITVSTLKPEPKDEMMLSINSDNATDSTFVNQSEILTSFEQIKDEDLKKKNSSDNFEIEEVKVTDEEEVFEALNVNTAATGEQNASHQLSPNSTSSNISVEYVDEAKKIESLNKKSHIDFIRGVEAGSSGNASSNDEPETCASEVLSDIEVLSLPSSRGEYLSVNNQLADKQHQNPSSLVPNSNLTKTTLPILIKSPPPLQSNNALLKQISPSSSSDVNKSSETTTTNEVTSNQVLAAREAHIIKLNTANVKLQEENDNLTNECERLKYEFKITKGDLAGRLEASCNERDGYKKACADLQAELASLKTELADKEVQMEQLTSEGLKLSKQELNQSNIIKKLRSKEKEVETVVAGLKSDLDRTKKELQELKKTLEGKNEAEKQNLETFKKLEKGAALLEKELTDTKMNYEESVEKIKSLENTLQNSFKELAELHRTNAQKTSQINETASSIENQYKEEISAAVDKERIVSGKKIESLKWELECVRADISRTEQQHALREDMLRKEIADLQHQLRDTEMRNNELSQNISTATRPLIRQIENLQHSNSSQIEALENSEKNLIERLKEAQANLCELSEKSRYDQENLMDMEQKLRTLEAQNQTLKSERSKLGVELKMVKASLDAYENERYEKEAETRVLIGTLTQQAEKLAREKKNLEIQLDSERSKLEAETKKVQKLLADAASERESNQQKRLEKQSELNTSGESKISVDEESSPSSRRVTRLSSNPSVLDNRRSSLEYGSGVGGVNANNINVLEALQSKLKQKDGEIGQLQAQISKLESVRESMAREMVNLSNNLESIKEKLKEYPQLQENFKKLNTEYNALLQMYGEKTEETEELRMDLQDVKEMYKLQIEDLIKRSNI